MGTSAEQGIAAEAVARALDALAVGVGQGSSIDASIATTFSHERHRRSAATRFPRVDSDRAFYAAVDAERREGAPSHQIARELVEHYAREIEGHFDPKVYAFATRALPILLTALLNGIAPRRMLARIGHLTNVDDHVHVGGEVELLQSLAREGTVMLVPTHCSNLDSLVMGYSIYRMGLPPFAYGAGRNLFSNKVEGFFMRHLGAYSVDRENTDPLYREVLKEYATVSLEHGHHNLFFPGGTRSRSGAIESRLKKGLLGTALTAFRRNVIGGKETPRVFVFPCTLSYPLVLEASTLIAEHLGRASRLITNDEYGRVDKWLAFLTGLMRLDVHIHVTIGSPLDPFGNDVVADGSSRDKAGNAIDPAQYLVDDGMLEANAIRDAERTNALAERVLEAYRRNNVVLPSAVVAYAVFEALRSRAQHRDVHSFLSEVSRDGRVSVDETRPIVEQLLTELAALRNEGRILLCETIRDRDMTAILDEAVRTLGSYHARPVLTQEGPALRVGDAPLLFYYRNRIDGYGLLGAPSLVGPH